MIVLCAVGVWGFHTYPFDTENVFLTPIQLQNPSVFQVLAYGYTTLWFTTPFLAASLVMSLVAPVVYRRLAGARSRASCRTAASRTVAHRTY
jgi:hypothetical protein